MSEKTLRYRTIELMFLLFLSGCHPGEFASDFVDWQDLESNWQLDTDAGCSLRIVPEGTSETNFLQIVAPVGARCEIVPRLYAGLRAKFQREPFESPRRYDFCLKVVGLGDFESDAGLNENTVVAQWHSSPDPILDAGGGRGPPLALRIHNGIWGITYGSDSELASDKGYIATNWHWVGPVRTGEWTNWSFSVTWAHSESGRLDVWRNDQLVMSRTGATAYNDLRGVYLKMGLYHPPDGQEILIDRVSIADSDADGSLTPGTSCPVETPSD